MVRKGQVVESLATHSMSWSLLKMFGSTQVVFGKTEANSVFFRAFQPTPVSSPSASAKKILQTQHAGYPALAQNSKPYELLPEEAQRLKDLLLANASRQQHSRFNIFKLKRVVIPPVQIPPELSTPHAMNNIVAGSRIPVTKTMSMRCRARMLRRLPRRIDEHVAW
ncbi:uncharacterized protein PHALS_06204 [Plasmopara halstedii]|uniref:Uncharacterized protein n=1 Tax=Plasmopara halstedii TaxID=4781 RepID=A0A0N7L7Y6_PLAHL|nr:uncharacterized protein PHALS_06204 [Plasmopara halstedii]CEG48379.1 hypothetical protein PHALS_06204 [Plasmopara halstedii]|eukprot:XP_024584748.1 hypothetical protein PHALS_06204 [Plasmopara halstedii]